MGLDELFDFLSLHLSGIRAQDVETGFSENKVVGPHLPAHLGGQLVVLDPQRPQIGQLSETGRYPPGQLVISKP